MDFLPMYEFHKYVRRYRGDYKVQSFSCLDQYLCMAFAQLIPSCNQMVNCQVVTPDSTL